MKKILIGNKAVGPNQKCFIVAEISASHNNSFAHTLKLVRYAKKCGADAIKLQTYTPDTITLKSNKKDFRISKKSPWKKFKNLWNLYNQAHMPWRWQKKIFDLCKKLKLSYFSSPFDETAVDFLEKIGSQAYKIASPEINHLPLIKKVAKTKKPIIISTGLASKKEIDEAVKTIKKTGNKKVIILKCTSSYPANFSDLNLKMIKTFYKRYKVNIGFSDHSIGYLPACIAVSKGAVMIEKHIKLGNSKKNVDNFFSSEIRNFKDMVDAIRNSEKILGSVNYNISESSRVSLNGKRSIYVTKNIKKNEVLTKNNIMVKRPAYGLNPKYYDKVIGKKINTNLYIGDRLSLKNIK